MHDDDHLGDIESRLRRLEYQLDVLGHRQALAEDYIVGAMIVLGVAVIATAILFRSW